MNNCIEKQLRQIKTKDRKSILCVPLYLYIFIQYTCVHRIQQISLSHTAKSMPTVQYQLHCFSRQRKPLDLFHCFSEIFEHSIFDVLSLMRGYWVKSTAIWHTKMSQYVMIRKFQTHFICVIFSNISLGTKERTLFISPTKTQRWLYLQEYSLALQCTLGHTGSPGFVFVPSKCLASVIVGLLF